MMIERFIKLLNENEKVADWKITQNHTISTELFYVGKLLENSRKADTVSYEATIYVDQDGYRGSARFSVYDYMSDEELSAKIEDNVYAASFVKNAFFEIPAKEEAHLVESASNLKDRDTSDLLEELVKAIFAADLYDHGSLSATEFFLTQKSRRILNSRGVDLFETSWSGNVEVIPAWEQDGEEAEVYHMYRFESLDPSAVTADLQEQIDFAKERFAAKNLTEIADVKGLKVIIQGEEAGEILQSFGDDLSYSAKHMKVNHTEIGDDVQAGVSGQVTGSRINLRKMPYYQGCTASAGFDGDGVILKPIQLIKDGIAINRFGDYTSGYYLGVEKPSGNIPVTVVEEGEKTFAEMAAEPYVRCIKWSGIQIDRNSGFFGGEVRFGYYFDGKKEIPVTGFTVSGNLEKTKESFVFSKETISHRNYHGPRYLEIRDMEIV